MYAMPYHIVVIDIYCIAQAEKSYFFFQKRRMCKRIIHIVICTSSQSKELLGIFHHVYAP